MPRRYSMLGLALGRIACGSGESRVIRRKRNINHIVGCTSVHRETIMISMSGTTGKKSN